MTRTRMWQCCRLTPRIWSVKLEHTCFSVFQVLMHAAGLQIEPRMWWVVCGAAPLVAIGRFVLPHGGLCVW